MKQSSMWAGALGLGAFAGMVSYLSMSPRSQREWERNLKKSVHELTDLVEEIGDGIRSMRG